MRLLIFCDEDLSVAAGGARQVLEFSRALKARGHDLRVVVPNPCGPVDPSFSDLRLCTVPVIRLAVFRPLSYLLLSGIVLAKHCVGWRPDALLWFDSPGQVAPLICAQFARCPYVLFVNGLPEEVQGFWNWAPLRGMLQTVLKVSAARAAAVVSVCQEILEGMQQRWNIPAERCRLIQNGVDPTRFHSIDTRAARRTLGLDTSTLRVGFVGGFFPWHGLDTLIEAVPLVLRTISHVEFLLVGDGPLRRSLEEKVHAMGLEPSVKFPGRVELGHVPAWMAACDVCVVLHRATRSYPGDSMKLWEYLACERPVVATAGSGYGDSVEAIGCGLAVKPDDPGDLARQLLRLFHDPEERAKMGERGRVSVLHAHTWETRASELEKVCLAAITAAAMRRSSS